MNGSSPAKVAADAAVDREVVEAGTSAGALQRLVQLGIALILV
jgi:hypothetical protein